MAISEPEFSKTICDENGRVLQIDYFVTSGFCETDGAQGNPTFGISARLSIDGRCSDKSTVVDVSPSREIAARITQLLARNFVTPVALRDVIEDCLAAQL
jgi:hypothetical protein